MLPALDDFRNGEMKLVLGSASEARRGVLDQLGIPFEIRPSSFPETLDKSLIDPSEYSLCTSREKHKELLPTIDSDVPVVLITCDTVVVVDGTRILEKPENATQATEMLMSLSGIEHEVITGVVVSLIMPKSTVNSVEVKSISKVKFKEINFDEMQMYLSTGEWKGKAGGYAIQGIGQLFVADVQGSYTNVIGLPLFEVSECIRKLLYVHGERSYPFREIP